MYLLCVTYHSGIFQYLIMHANKPISSHYVAIGTVKPPTNNTICVHMKYVDTDLTTGL